MSRHEAGDGDYLKPPPGRLQPKNASFAILQDESGRYLMQLRDDRPDIFWPAHWGLFGGALDPGESFDNALAREMREETGLDVDSCEASLFTRLTFDFDAFGFGQVTRAFYTIAMPDRLIPSLRLGEGQEMRFFRKADVLHQKIVPHDSHALWMHIYRRELAGS